MFNRTPKATAVFPTLAMVIPTAMVMTAMVQVRMVVMDRGFLGSLELRIALRLLLKNQVFSAKISQRNGQLKEG